MIYSKPDPSICDWWDWKQSCGRIVRIKYMSNWYVKDWHVNYCWHSVDRAYSQESIDFIGGKFKPIPMTTEF